jgi:transcriptional regulator with XRE-family HTH domain
MNKFCENLSRLRKENNLSQQGLADKIGVTQQCISEWEKGNIEPTLSNLIKLADFFDVAMDYLAGRKDY